MSDAELGGVRPVCVVLASQRCRSPWQAGTAPAVRDVHRDLADEIFRSPTFRHFLDQEFEAR